ncbi:hypothetical protein G4B88_021290 [Cannabis sativa]|uniref:Uncharacterized protein n=1 Tax=Cannabis sativa TaxID=3483 RepID=A0A7J6HY72_CANSA|nr:hypothetical protein G4B88_021290 [Cannabis sativa]
MSHRNTNSLVCKRWLSLQGLVRSLKLLDWGFLQSDAQAFQAHLLPPKVIDRGLQELANGCPNLRKVALVGATELGLLSLAEECSTLQDLELHKCNDNVLRGIAAYENLQLFN